MAISGRMSLRAPQQRSIEILDRVLDLVPLAKAPDLATALAAVHAEFPEVVDFERDFPSLCFALATGVGKTRLMGAFITYLYRTKGIRHFFVLAPGLTIYNKLIQDFTPNTPKYVFQGIAEFAAQPPVVITGDNYEDGRAMRPSFFDEVQVNIFNIAKINTEVRGGAAPRIKRLSECIGESYFGYLANLPDLVLLMDESHRYRADAGARAINELRPVLGLELTATPQVERGGRVQPFQNVAYRYPLAKAMVDGFVKEPAVAGRLDFCAADLNADQLERLKLEDGIRVHEAAKTELEVYARERNVPRVKPFLLVVASDIAHATELVAQIEAPDFFGGDYKGKVIQVDSRMAQRMDKGEADEVVQKLLEVESPDNPVEVVVHVNMLKEGWDVTNLYTIVPLRAASARTLVEQCIGRGLRLPYGRRTGVAAVDRLTIVAHDHFQEIVDEAHRGESVFKTGLVIGRDISDRRQQVLTVQPTAVIRALQGPESSPNQPAPRHRTQAETTVAQTVLRLLPRFQSLPSSAALGSKTVQQQIVEQVRTELTPAQYEIPGTAEPLDLSAVVRETTEAYHEASIDIPRIVVVPRGAVTVGFVDFDLDVTGVDVKPVNTDILLQYLRTDVRECLRLTDFTAGRPEDLVVDALSALDDISYDEHSDLIQKLAGQLVQHLHSYLGSDEDVRNVILYYQQGLVDRIHGQMLAHRFQHDDGFDVRVLQGFVVLRDQTYTRAADEEPRDARTPVQDRNQIRRMLFTGFRRCLYEYQKFDSDPERRFAVLLEDDVTTPKWFKPARAIVQIPYGSGEAYEPDFVVETNTRKLMCEIKADNEMADETVVAKARAAAVWCGHATAHARAHGGKPWAYLLVPESLVAANMTLDGLAQRCVVSGPPEGK